MANVLQPSGTAEQPQHLLIFIAALIRLLVCWLTMFVMVSLATYLIDREVLAEATLIALASGVISAMALLPGISMAFANFGSSGDQRPTVASKIVATIVAAMAIRVTGTVALLLLCRYQMVLPPRTMALFVGGWYAWLTSIEVYLLALSVKSLTTSTEIK